MNNPHGAKAGSMRLAQVFLELRVHSRVVVKRWTEASRILDRLEL